MTNMIGGLGSSGGSPTTGGTTTGGTSTTTQPQFDLASIIPDLTGDTPLFGGTSSTTAQSFDPALYQPGGLFSPTGTSLGTPATQEAQQDPSGQVPTEQQQEQKTRSAAPTTEQQQKEATPPAQTESPDQTPAGPTGLGGDQQQQQQGKSPLAQLVSSFLGGPQGRVAKVAQNLSGQPTPAPTAGAPAAQGATPQPGAPQPAAPQGAEPARVGPTSSQPVPGAQPSVTSGAAPAGAGGPPPFLQAIMNALRGLVGLPPEGGQMPLSQVAQQAYPQRQYAPVSPTAGLGPYARARMAAQPGKYEQPSQDEWNRNVSSGGALGPAPGSSDEVSAPTEQQARQGRLAGTDTPPTAGFSPVLERERAKFRNELTSNPRTRWETLAMIALEQGGDPAAVAESLLNRSDYAKTSLHNMLHSGFYGPVNFGKLGHEIRRLQSDPQRAAKLNAGLETALRGSNLLGGATDQGSGRDPNVGHRGGRVVRFGEIYNDWGGGPGGHAGAANYRHAQQQRVRAGQQASERGQQFAMDIGRRSPFPVPGAEVGAMPRGGTVFRSAPGTEFENITEQRRRREIEQQRERGSLVS